MTKVLWRTLVAIHRYLGIAVGLMMAIWFASGAVMMYVGFPELAEKERIARLPPLDWQSCCRFPAEGLEDSAAFEQAQVESLLKKPVLRLHRTLLPDIVIDLAQGAVVEVDERLASAIATPSSRQHEHGSSCRNGSGIGASSGSGLLYLK